MANPSNPPPGNTTTAIPVFFPVGAYIVIVGCVTLSTQMTGLPPTREPESVFIVSGPGTACASGTVPGHIGICACPGDGCQICVCAIEAALHTKKTQIVITRGFIAVGTKSVRDSIGA